MLQQKKEEALKNRHWTESILDQNFEGQFRIFEGYCFWSCRKSITLLKSNETQWIEIW